MAMLTEKQRAQAAIRQQRFRKRQQDVRRREQCEKGLPPMPKITAMPGSARWKATIEAAEALLSQAAEEMDDYWNERSETWQEGYVAEEHRQRKKRLTKMAETLSDMAIEW
jgi:hypothetical protein